MGTLIRHAPLCAAFAVFASPVTVIEPSFGTLLVPPIGTAKLPSSHLVAAFGAAVTLSAITVRTQKEDRAAFIAAAKPQPQNDFAVRSHACLQAGLDSGGSFVAP